MPGYIYRDELLERLAPLLELLECEPKQLHSLRVTVHGIELDKVNPDPFAPYDFAFYPITDKDPAEVESGDPR